jgi:hypothetical protein
MPSTSKRQHNLMEMVAHDPAAAKRLGIPQSVGRDFAAADKGRDLSKLPVHAGPHREPDADDTRVPSPHHKTHDEPMKVPPRDHATHNAPMHVPGPAQGKRRY